MQKKRSHTKPKMMDKKDPSKMAILEILMAERSLKASVAIKIDIVKPIPASRPAPIICCQELKFGSLPHLNFTVKKQLKNIPRGLPIKRPAIIPQLKVLLMEVTKFEGKIIAVFAKANIGIINKFTGLLR